MTLWPDAYPEPPEPVPVDEPRRRRTDYTARARNLLAAGRHPATRLAGIDPDPAHTCGMCGHLRRYLWRSKSYYKCPMHALGESHSEASDMRLSWPGCHRWTPVGGK